MKVTDHNKCLQLLKELNKEIQVNPGKQEVTEKITLFLDENQESFKENVEIAAELDSIGVKVKKETPEDPLVNKICQCVKQILPNEGELRGQSLKRLREVETADPIVSDWIRLMDIPADELDLRGYELLEILRSELQDPRIPLDLTNEAIEDVAACLSRLQRPLTEREKKVVFLLVKKFAAKDGGLTAAKIKSFRLTDPEELAAIAKICAQQNGRYTALRIENFGKMDAATLYDIAILCARSSPFSVAQIIPTFGFWDDQIEFKIFAECVKCDSSILHRLHEISILPSIVAAFYQEITSFEREEKPNGEEILRIFNQVIKEVNCSDHHRSQLCAMAQKISELNSHQQFPQAKWFMASLMILIASHPESTDWMIEKGLLKDLYALRDSKLTWKLTQGLPRLADSEQSRARWEQWVSSDLKKGMRLLAIPLADLESEGVNRELIDSMLLKISHPHLLKDALKIQKLLFLLSLFASNSQLTTEQKGIAITKIFIEPKDIKQVLENMTAAKGLLLMKERDWINSQENLKNLFRSSFQQLIPLEGFQGDMNEVFEKTFGSCAVPEGIMEYAAGLNTLKETEPLKCLGRYVVAVFNGTFRQMRYATNGNPHLAKIYSARPDLKEAWGNIRELMNQPAVQEEHGSKESFDSRKWLQTQIIDAPQLTGEDKSHLIKFLSAENDMEKEEIIKGLTTLLSTLSKGKKRTELDQDRTILNLKFQLASIKLMGSGNEVPYSALEKHLKSIAYSLENLGFKEDWISEVSRSLATVSKRPEPMQRNEALQAMVTDDPYDLLLMGSLVADSCQSVNGDPEKNKALLGYMMDGKNQLLVLKDASGRIRGRALLRLLWDGEKPVLFREQYYPRMISESDKRMLNQYSIQLAKKLKIPLTAIDNDRAPYGRNLRAFKGPAPYDYSDADQGLRPDGILSIGHAGLIFSG